MRNVLTVRRVLATASLTAVGVTILAAPGLARAEGIAYAGSANASAVALTFRSPGFPVSDVPLDGGGPTAGAALDTAGTSQAFAIFPNPGPVASGGAGTLAGLLGSGAGGLPPIALPPTPAYPFQAQSDASGVREATAGQGPYALHATSSDTSSTASAHVGGTSDSVGNAVFAHAESAVMQAADGGVEATAASGAQGLAVGPLTIGEISTTASAIADQTGRVTPATTALIAGMKIGGQPVSVNSDGLNAGGVPIPLPVSESMNKLLSASGITVTLIPTHNSEDAAVAPAIVISMPADLRPIGLGTAPGTMTITLGGSTARLDTSQSAGTAGSPAPSDAVQQPIAVGAADGTGLDAGALPATVSDPAGTAAGPAGAHTAVLVPAAASSVTTATFDMTGVYVFVATGAVAALILAQLTGLLGVRRSWTSDAG